MSEDLGLCLSSSRLRVVAALIEAGGSAAEAAHLLGVSRQYVYETISKLRSCGVRLRGIPAFGALGRAFLLLSPERPHLNKLLVTSLKVYSFAGDSYYASLVVIPPGAALTEPLHRERSSQVIEVLDVLPAAPWYDVDSLRPWDALLPPKPPPTRLDDEDRAVLTALYESILSPVTESMPGASKSRLSYHYRHHVKPLLRVLLDGHPIYLYPRPLLLAEVAANSEEWLASLLKAQQVYLLMPKMDRASAIALLDPGRDLPSFIKRVVDARRERGLGLRFSLLGFVDNEESEKVRIPPALLQGSSQGVTR